MACGLRLGGARLDVCDEGMRLVVRGDSGLSARPRSRRSTSDLAEVQPAERVVRRLGSDARRRATALRTRRSSTSAGPEVVRARDRRVSRASRTLNVRPGCASVPACTTSSARGRSGSGSSRAPRRRRRPFGCVAVRPRSADPRAPAFPASYTACESTGAVITRSSDGFSSPPSADQTSESARSSGGGRATVTGMFSGCSRATPRGYRAGARRSEERAGEHGREQAVLVLGALGPRRDEVGELEHARRPALGRRRSRARRGRARGRRCAAGGPRGCRRGRGRASARSAARPSPASAPRSEISTPLLSSSRSTSRRRASSTSWITSCLR